MPICEINTKPFDLWPQCLFWGLFYFSPKHLSVGAIIPTCPRCLVWWQAHSACYSIKSKNLSYLFSAGHCWITCPAAGVPGSITRRSSHASIYRLTTKPPEYLNSSVVERHKKGIRILWSILISRSLVLACRKFLQERRNDARQGFRACPCKFNVQRKLGLLYVFCCWFTWGSRIRSFQKISIFP